MTKITLNPWDKKPRTALRSIKPGDIFMFRLGSDSFGIGRILSKVSIGHVAEFFEPILSIPDLGDNNVDTIQRRGQPLIIDSYSLFDRKLEGDWRIVGHEVGFEPKNVNGIYFIYGTDKNLKKVSIFDEESVVDEKSASTLEYYSPNGDIHIRHKLF